MVTDDRHVSRRRVLRIGGGAALLGAAGSRGANGIRSDPVDGAQEDGDGDVQETTLVATEGQAEVAPGEIGETWLYDDRYPGPELRVREGDTLRVSVENRLPDDTTVHWHGVPVPNPMDGVPNVTQDPVPPGETFTYEYEASPPGTYVYHSHVGLQLDRALNGPLIVEEASPHVEYDREHTLVVDDFLSGDPMLDSIEAPPGGGPGGGGGRSPGGPGGGRSPGGPGGGRSPGGGGGRSPGGGGRSPGGRSPGGRGPGGRGPGGRGPGGRGPGGRGGGGRGRDGRMGGNGPMQGRRPPYRGMVVNGRLPSDPPVFDVQEGERVRLRFINPGGATTYRVGVGGHSLIITHADGRPVEPVEVDSFTISMGERYDAIVEANSPGEWAIVATPVVGSEQPAEAILRYDGTNGTDSTGRPQFDGRALQYDDLRALEPLDLDGAPDRTFDFTLSGGMMQEPGTWTINGQVYPNADPLEIREGEHVRVRMVNRSPAIHPMHLHGHFFQVGNAVMDTVLVPPFRGQVSFDFLADNPGDWLFHCHNNYHLERGMARVFEYV